MIDFYPIVKVSGEWKVDPEPMGTKRKFWYLEPGSDVSWLFKYPREGTGEHWAEKIAAEVAEALEIRHAYVELAEIEGGQDGSPPVRGSTTRSFLDDGSVLIHGNEIMARVLSDYHQDLRFGQFFHTFENILIGLEMSIRDFSEWEKVSQKFCQYLVLDALVGNTDRHHENWGLVEKRHEKGFDRSIAPTFDHASSLGRELSDERRKLLLQEDRVGGYSERAPGAVYWVETNARPPSPLQLVRWAASKYPDFFTLVLSRLESLDFQELALIVERIPRDWMSEASRTFAVGLMYYNREQLISLLNEI